MALDNPTEEQHHVSSENKDPEIWCKNKQKKYYKILLYLIMLTNQENILLQNCIKSLLHTEMEKGQTLTHVGCSLSYIPLHPSSEEVPQFHFWWLIFRNNMVRWSGVSLNYLLQKVICFIATFSVSYWVQKSTLLLNSLPHLWQNIALRTNVTWSLQNK